MPKVTIIGATSFGITMGMVLAPKIRQVVLWARTEEEAEKLKTSGPNPEVLPGVNFPPHFAITSNLKEAVEDTRAVIIVVPSQAMRQNIMVIREHLKKPMLIISAAKGLEIGTNKRMSQVIADEIPPRFHQNICILSGPNLYKEILLDLPAATVIAAEDEKTARNAQRLINTDKLCVYTNTDVVGVELGGALKNIIALGAGMADGLGYGDNAKAAFITRGLTEITALGVALGASPLTFSGLAGLGDLTATCASPLSRNHHVGVELTKGRPLEEILSTMKEVAEGVTTTTAAWDLAQKLGLEMPITEKVYRVLHNGLSPKQAAAELMAGVTQHELTGRRWKLFAFFRRRKRS